MSQSQWEHWMSSVLSAQLFLCHWKTEVADGLSKVVQSQLIINSVLCCCGVAGLLESDLCFLADHTHWQEMFNRVPGNEAGGHSSLCACLLLFLTLFISLTFPPLYLPLCLSALSVSFLQQRCISVSGSNCLFFFIPVSHPSLSVSSSQSLGPLSHSHTAVHVRGNNGSCECAWNNTAGELLLSSAQRTHTPHSLKSYWHSSNAALALPLSWRCSLGKERKN